LVSDDSFPTCCKKYCLVIFAPSILLRTND
jgi:hypothetical protein